MKVHSKPSPNFKNTGIKMSGNMIKEKRPIMAEMILNALTLKSEPKSRRSRPTKTSIEASELNRK